MVYRRYATASDVVSAAMAKRGVEISAYRARVCSRGVR
jgi:hypothetical protein